ncbi:MAG: molybdate ABC transporter substrate-binding protein [Solirubrobacteraceae bacterium]|nr:molybdate ABC transporter substrate-binding protein [Solirubrobacteraceae bacterium]
MRRIWILPMLLAAFLAASGCGGGGELRVSAAASLQASFTEYGGKFEEAEASFSFAGSDVLAAQIRSGARPDVYAAANTTLPDALYVEQLVEKPIRFASNELVLAKPANSRKITSLADIRRSGVRLAIGSPTVPVGSYTRTVLAKLLRSQREAIYANVRTEEPDVSGIVGKLTQGAVDAGFVYRTDVRATNGRLEEITLPSRLQPVVEYSVAVVRGTERPAEAKAFVYGLLSGDGRRALDGAGFQPPARTG